VDEASEVVFTKAVTPEQKGDTVGAGDAFAAATSFGISRDRALDETLRFAARFASRACTIQGATTPDHGHYAQGETENLDA